MQWLNIHRWIKINFFDFLNFFYRKAKTKDYSLLNFAVTDGKTVVVTQYVSKDTVEPAILYFYAGIIYTHITTGVIINTQQGSVFALSSNGRYLFSGSSWYYCTILIFDIVLENSVKFTVMHP